MNKSSYTKLSIVTFIAILFILLVVYLVKIKATIVLAMFLIVYTIISIMMLYAKDKKLHQDKKNINKSFKMTFQTNINKIQTPIAFISNEGDILWKNDLCSSNITDEQILGIVAKYLNDKISKECEFETSLSKNYIAKLNNCNLFNKDMIVITFLETTGQYLLKKELEDSKANIATIVIDNYDETFQGISEIDKLEIIALIDTKLRTFVEENLGYIKKIEKDKYVFVIKEKYINKLKDKSFEILQEIKNISNKTKLPITLSIGISGYEDEYLENHKSSISALDVAQGRGGNQVVIKKNKKFEFYGELNEELEKTSRVKSRSVASALVDIISKMDNIYVVGHKNPDTDCIGAAIGIAKICSSYEKKANIVIDFKNNESAKLMIDKIMEEGTYKDNFITKEEFKKLKITSNDLLIVVDTHKKTYLLTNDGISKFENVIVIDHHRRGAEFIEDTVLTYHEIYSSSTCELVTQIIMHLDNIKLSMIEAESLYAGILIDTKNFSYKTGVRTFEVAAFLKSIGIDITEVKSMFQNDFDTYLIKAEIIKSAKLIEDKVAIAVCDTYHDNISTIIAQTADELLNINSILASFVLCKVDNKVIISSRSNGDLNVQSIMEKLGGGGHLTVAGAQVEDKDLKIVKEELINIISKQLEQLES